VLPREHEWPLTSRRFTSVLVVLDGSDGCWCALDAALALCQEAGAQLTVLSLEARLSVRSTVVRGFETAERSRQAISERRLQQAEVFASFAGVDVIAHRLVPSSWKVVAAYATEHRQDLVVVCARRGVLRGRLLPSIADRIAASVPCPVMIVRPGGESVERLGAR
jgi:nucleotide-binding universal stress UspA family protein